MDIFLTNFNNLQIDSINENLLSNRAKQKISNLKQTNKNRAMQCAIADLILKSELLNRGITSFELCENTNGKPFLKNGELNFNVAHQNTIVALATNHTPVGLDIQKLDDSHQKLFSTVLNEYEVSIYNTLESDAQKTKYFFRCFTEKESYVKLHGDRLPYPPSTIKSYEGAKFVTKYLFLNDSVYCLTVCASEITDIKIKVINAKDLLKQ